MKNPNRRDNDGSRDLEAGDSTQDSVDARC